MIRFFALLALLVAFILTPPAFIIQVVITTVVAFFVNVRDAIDDVKTSIVPRVIKFSRRLITGIAE